MSTPAQVPRVWADDDTLAAVRPEVRSILEASPGFQQLAPEEKRALAADMVKVASYMSNPDGLAKAELSPEGGILAREQSAVEDTKKRLAGKQGFAGAEFEAGALRQGTEQFGELVQKVDFPQFVSGLIQNVFQAIVDSSIEQMRAYGELVANVAKTVDQFAQDNITENNARDWLTDRFPGEIGVRTDVFGGAFDEDGAPVAGARLEVTSDDPDATLQKINEALQIARAVTDISDEEDERRLVQAARLQIARGRQQLLASMVMLGINRIVVTDGLIHAKVVFDFRASDEARRASRASMLDRKKSGTAIGYRSPGWFGGVSASHSSEHMTTVQSSVAEESESRAELKARLTGEVRVNFKSDYLPMDKLATPQMIASIQGHAAPRDAAPAAS